MLKKLFCAAVSVAVQIAAIVPRELQEMTSVPVQYRHDQIGFKMFN